MGLIKKLIGGLFTFVGGVLKSLLGIVGIGKKSDFYMEVAEDGGKVPAPSPVQVAAPTQAVKELVPTPKPEVTAPAPEATSPTLVPDASLSLAKVVADGKPQTGVTFAADPVVSLSGRPMKRRRPGPSLSPFKDMARTIGKTPSMG